MSSLRILTSTLSVSAMTALLGVSCVSQDNPVDMGDDAKIEPAVGVGQETLAVNEDEGQSVERSTAADQLYSGDYMDELANGDSRGRQYYAPPPPGPGFTFSCAGFWNGVWCGGNRGFPGSPYALYYCYNGTGQLIQNCPGYCHAEPAGHEDHC
ncbi:hypothetical protein WME90_08035 [Sorangium sp. So ce375]|uniref:hypothetical protein n=1 Tax=Sorangium sp. So ce375 TaxID=3133306 RepID=UPI003F5B5677